MSVNNQSGGGHLGFGIVGGGVLEHQLFDSRVIQGLRIKAPTSASTQATGAGASDFNVDIDWGLLAVQRKVIELQDQADFDLASSGSALLTSGQSFIVSIIAYRSQGDGVIRLKTVKGTAAVTGSEVSPVRADIEAGLAAGTVWMKLADVTVNRTGDLVVTQSQDNSVRPNMIPQTVHNV